jgi:hypothetical protein
VHHRAATVAASNRQQTLGFEDSQRFAQRHEADIELLDKDFLPREQVAVGQFAFDDLPAELVGHDLGGSARRQPASCLGSNSQCCHVLAILTVIGRLPGVYGSAICQK